ncbi:unnamed protein product [Symbiodinium sp. CCMP2456]|nr:unnamed protein product [Symbiodinium sp. CCMP2456]
MTPTRAAVKPSLPLSARDLARRAQRSEHIAELPEVASAVLPQHLSFLRTQRKQAEDVSAHDFFQRQDLHQKMSSLALSDHFDSFGKCRFQRLGLAFAAKQFTPKPVAPQRSLTESLTDETRKPSAKAFILSQEALAADFERWSQHTRGISDSIKEVDRHKDADVKKRQSDILFAELPFYLEFLPESVPLESLESEMDREKPGFPRRWPSQSRKFRRTESQALIEIFRAWSFASWPLGGAELGMDRATFSRFVLDVGLVDQRKVPLYWSLSLFDCLSHTTRVCAKDDPIPMSAPLLPMVKWWDILAIVEVLTCQHFRTSTTALRVKFIENVAEISRFRLPAYALKAFNISQAQIELVLQGVKTDSNESDDEQAKGHQEMPSKAVESRRSGNEAKELGTASKEQMVRMEEARGQRQKGSLVEPEVLHLLWQHEAVFQELHAAYADHEGHMTFAALTQLCKDFSLAPHLISLHQLRKIYESAECLDTTTGAPARIDLGQDFGLKKGRGASPSRSPQASGRRRSVDASTTSTHSDTVRSARRPSDVSGLRNKRSTIVSLGKINARHAAVSDSPSQSRRRSIEAGSISGHSANERLGSMLPWERLVLKVREASSRLQTTVSSVGFQALMEILCKVAYTYLGCYGNMQQRSMSPLLQTVWLLVYLRFSTESYRRSLEKRSEDARSGALRRITPLLNPEVWAIGKAPQFEDDLPPQTFRDLAAASTEGAALCIADETCQLCKAHVQEDDWGNVRCFACSKIDVLAFKHHPLRFLIRRPWDSKSVVIAGKVPRVRNISLTPPPFKDSNALRPESSEEAPDPGRSFHPSSSSFSDV